MSQDESNSMEGDGLTGLDKRLFMVDIILKAAAAVEANDSKGEYPGLLEFLRQELAETGKSGPDIPAGILENTIRKIAKICPIPLDRYIE